MRQDEWHGCFRRGWGHLLVQDAFSHPAKAAYGISKRVYDHAMEHGWLRRGDLVLDPFGGVACFAFHAMENGLGWVGVEIEQKFVELGRKNIALWNERYDGKLPGWLPLAMLFQGDSRYLSEVLGQTLYDGVISSPPFGQAQSGGGIAQALVGNTDYPLSQQGGRYQGYQAEHSGLTKGNLSNMSFQAIISSPPYEASMNSGKHGVDTSSFAGVSPNCQLNIALAYTKENGNNLGSQAGDTFWSAAKTIMIQVHQVLCPDGHAIFVTRDFVRNKQIVPFSQQWVQLCESCGFKLVHWHKASLIEDRGTQIDLEGNHHSKSIKRASFFRLLAERKGSPRIDWEDITCFAKTASAISSC